MVAKNSRGLVAPKLLPLLPLLTNTSPTKGAPHWTWWGALPLPSPPYPDLVSKPDMEGGLAVAPNMAKSN